MSLNSFESEKFQLAKKSMRHSLASSALTTSKSRTNIMKLTSADLICAKIESDYAKRATRPISNDELKRIDLDIYKSSSTSSRSFNSNESPRQHVHRLTNEERRAIKTPSLPLMQRELTNGYTPPSSGLMTSRLSIVDHMQRFEILNRKIRMINLENKSILREKQPILFQSMHVDKWLNVFVHPQKKMNMENLHNKLFAQMNKQELKKTQVNLVNKLDYSDILRQLNRIETNNGFNMIVDRIKGFLSECNENRNEKDNDSTTSISLCYKNLKNNRTLGQNFKLLGFSH